MDGAAVVYVDVAGNFVSFLAHGWAAYHQVTFGSFGPPPVPHLFSKEFLGLLGGVV
jgi:hypothetical protein